MLKIEIWLDEQTEEAMLGGKPDWWERPVILYFFPSAVDWTLG
jgi:hypothetical protein